MSTMTWRWNKRWDLRCQASKSASKIGNRHCLSCTTSTACGRWQDTWRARMCAAKWTNSSLLGQHCCEHFRCIGLASLWHWTNLWLSFVTTPHCIGFWQVPLRTNWPQINLTILLDWMSIGFFLIEKTPDLGKHHHMWPTPGCAAGQACSLTCGSGTRKRSRTVQVVANDLGKDCVTWRRSTWWRWWRVKNPTVL